MSSVVSDSLLATVRPIYPERAEAVAEDWLEEFGDRVGGIGRALRARGALRTDLVARVRACEKELAGLAGADLLAAARDLGKSLRRDGFQIELVARAFAMVGHA